MRGFLICLALLSGGAGAADLEPVPGTVQCSWIGNTFEGAGPNGEGRWIQNGIDEIEVTPDGTVIAAVEWDEAGRCIGLYRDGDTHRKLLQQFNGKGGHKAWGWGTATQAIAASGDSIFAVNTEGDLMRFRWKPGDLESARFEGQVQATKARGLVARGESLVLITQTGEVQLRKTSDLGQTSSFKLAGAADAAVAADGSLWILAGKEILHFSPEGKALPEKIIDAANPTSVAFDRKERLIVCDNGPRQQVLFYDLKPAPKRAATFGQEGGLRAGMPGEALPDKLFMLRGAGMDKDGNLYVGMGLGGPNGNAVIRSFSPDGRLRWEVASHFFVDCADFDPTSDGLEVYSTDEIFVLDLARPPGKQWKLKSMTLDAVRYPDDVRLTDRGGSACTAILRRLEGRRVMYTIGQMSGGFHIWAFESEKSDIARCTGSTGKNDGWAWEVDSAGGIWRGDAPNRTVRYYPFQGFTAEGAPKYDWEKPVTSPQPAPFTEVARVSYVPASDTLYVGGYTQDRKAKSWGCIGSVLTRYDGWLKGERKERWSVPLPVDDEQLHPKSIAIAGDYLFTVQVKSLKGKPAVVSVFRAEDGRFVGTLVPGAEVGGNSGWVDQSHGLRAFKRKNGEYLVLVEEDWRGKNLLYRWTPEAKK
jgi:hypothetical protein